MILTIYTADQNCECCKATITWLEERGIDYKVVNLNDYETEAIDEKEKNS